MAFTNFSASLRQLDKSPHTPGEVLAGRAFLGLALASFAYPEIGTPWQNRQKTIVVQAGGNGVITFDVPVPFGIDNDSVVIRIGLEHFDPDYHEQRLEFLAFRAFVDEVRRLPARNDGGEFAETKIGPFEIFTSPEYMVKWGELWSVWEHAHGM